jgi:hypothetical protein
VTLYRSPPPHTHVICVDELDQRLLRPTSVRGGAADYRRRGNVWTVGAFEPRTGQALTYCADGRTSAHCITLLNQIVTTWTEGEIILILDNLSTHKALDVLLWALRHPHVRFLFQPTYTPWLNLIDPWWKTLRSLALKGRCFLDTTQISQAIQAATDYWNNHRRPYEWRCVFS